MTHSFSCLTDDDIKAILWVLLFIRRFSEKDECYVVSVSCVKCGRIFEEEFGEAESKVSARKDFLCLGCDSDASAASFQALMVNRKWVL